MSNYSFSFILRQVLSKYLSRTTKEISFDELAKSGIVFSPHFDDETLGCGGTIIKKVEAGADVRVVFMTDGSKSHDRWMSEDDLCNLRKSEGIAAVGKLGIEGDHVHTLGFPETRLAGYSKQASEQVKALLLLYKPEQVFIPYSGEPLMWSSDHIYTTKIVLDAAQFCSLPFTIYEYPIWAWFHFPWMRFQRENVRTFLGNSYHYRLGHRILKDLNLIY